ncbi:EGFlike domain containing protein [Balamuthia mandrillaris]
MEWIKMCFYAAGFEKTNYSQIVVHGELYMRENLAVPKSNGVSVYMTSYWAALAGDASLRSPSFILFDSLRDSNVTKIIETSTFSYSYVLEQPKLFVVACNYNPERPSGESVDCISPTSRHDLSYLLTSAGISDDCPSYTCPGTPVCSGRGRCVDGYCLCDPGWADLDCSAEDCPGSPDCNGHGYCLVDISRTPSCQCLDGWSGEACGKATCPNDCTDEEHGYCDTSSLKPTCVCNPGFVPGLQKDCSVHLLRCPGLEASCSGFGTCNNQTGNCSCMPGRTGADCSIPVCEGNPNQCSHHGLCLWDEQSNKAFCDCDEGWGGEDCSLPQCPSSSCSGHGVCVTELDPPRCLCDGPEDILSYSDPPLSKAEGWTGEACAMRVMDCNSEESRCGARCGENNDEGYGCMTNECLEGWKGWDCTTPVCVNTGNPECHGHGRCIARERNLTPQCECREGWLPPDCRLAICSADDGEKECSGRGRCNLQLSPPQCQCDAFAYGPFCQFYDPPCAGEPECSGHGQCNNGTCHCNEDWRGLDCSIIDHQGECAHNCSSNGVCKPSSSSEGKNLLPVCHCFEGWAGTDCSRSSSGEAKGAEEDFMEEHPWALPVIVAGIVVLLLLGATAIGSFVVYRQRELLKLTASLVFILCEDLQTLLRALVWGCDHSLPCADSETKARKRFLLLLHAFPNHSNIN